MILHTRDLDGETYDPWSEYAANSLKERCRYDIESRYDGICTILFELAVYDDGTGQGALDPVAFAGFQQVLTDLQDLAEETGAVFMTLGQYAAARHIEDSIPPVISITSPTASTYGHQGHLPIDFMVTDVPSGVYSVNATLDGMPVSQGDFVDLLTLDLGEHTFAILAEDTAGNVSQSSVTFTIEATFESLAAAVNEMAVAGTISDMDVVEGLLDKIIAAQGAADRGRANAAENILKAFIRLVKAQAGKSMDQSTADLLITDALFLIDSL